MDINDKAKFSFDVGNELDNSQLSVHLRITKRSGRKSITTIEGIAALPAAQEIKMDDLLKELRKKLNCNGSLKEGIMSLQGDHRDAMKLYLVNKGLCKLEQIKIHGF
jgi:translation initiation factor 1